MSKTKRRKPRTDAVWLGWHTLYDYATPWMCGSTRKTCKDRIAWNGSSSFVVPVKFRLIEVMPKRKGAKR